MKNFKYSLENVLKYRKDKEETLKQEYSNVERNYLIEKEKLEELERKLDSAVNSNAKNTSREVTYRKNVYNYIQFLREKIVLQRELTLNYKDELEQKRSELVSAQKERKTIEKLKEKAYTKYKVELNRQEQKLNDELAMFSYLRNS
ncbi:MAG: flagellar export protein FliJ [Firmicutes bacterium]|nr:flagellar export protein FliJ [Bacillota bacterium]